jgi:tetratricopeptide (TPR) repeat protein
MGVVYAAYDPELDRRVALKLLHRHSRSDRGESRLVREARAMARLSHPNVITVLDVGSTGSEVFIAMEFVPGGTLGTWLGEAKRSVTEIIEMYIAAGEGLCAAHDGGLVHRDFKPDNVLVGADGIAKVTDFGIARAAADGGEEERGGGATDHEIEPSKADTSREVLTQTGALMGTPAYMSPEQFRGEEADARSDQFSYCVALYQALYGERPFSGDTPASIALAATEGEVRSAPRGSNVPARVRRALLRGLETDPLARWPNLEALLDELGKETRPAWQKWRGLALAATTVGVLGVALWGGGDPKPIDPCADAAKSVERVWNEDAERRALDGLRAVSTPFTEHTVGAVDRLMNEYVREWVEIRVDACEATNIRHEQSGELFDLRVACLGSRRAELGALMSLFETADEKTLQRAVKAAEALSSLSTCSDPDALRMRVPYPQDAALRAEVEALEEGLAQLRALYRVGQYEEAAALGKALSQRSGKASFAPVHARILYHYGVSQRRLQKSEAAIETMRESTVSAAEAGDDALVARGFARLASYHGWGKGRTAEAKAFMFAAEVALDRAGGEQLDVRKVLAHSRGLIYSGARDYPRAREAFMMALELGEQIGGKESLSIVSPLAALGEVESILGHGDAARVSAKRAVAIVEAQLGEHHPDMLNVLDSLGFVAEGAWDRKLTASTYDRLCKISRTLYEGESRNYQACDQAPMANAELAFDYPALEAAVRVRLSHLDEAFKGRTTGSVVVTRLRVVKALLGQGNWDEAIIEAQETYADSVELRGGKHAGNATPKLLLGDALVGAGRLREAEAHYRGAVELVDTELGPGHVRSVQFRIGLGDFLYLEGAYKESLEEFDAALAAAEGTWPTNDRRLGRLYVSAAHAAFDSGQSARADDFLSRADLVKGKHTLTPETVASLHFAHAKQAHAAADLDETKRRFRQAMDEAEQRGRAGHAQVAGLHAWGRPLGLGR